MKKDKSMNGAMNLLSQAKIKSLVNEVLALCKDKDEPIPADKQAEYLGCKTTHEYHIKCAQNDPENSVSTYEALKSDILKVA